LFQNDGRDPGVIHVVQRVEELRCVRHGIARKGSLGGRAERSTSRDNARRLDCGDKSGGDLSARNDQESSARRVVFLIASR
jgi:hypothetical protein